MGIIILHWMRLMQFSMKTIKFIMENENMKFRYVVELVISDKNLRRVFKEDNWPEETFNSYVDTWHEIFESVLDRAIKDATGTNLKVKVSELKKS